MTKRIISLLLCLLILFSASGCSRTVFKSEGLLQPQQMKEDMDYLYKNIINTHPKIKEQNFKNEYAKLFEKLYSKIKKQMPAEEFFFIVKEALIPFHDAHTSVYYSVNNNSNIKIIPLRFLWLNDGMIVSNNSDLLKKGDRIISIGNKTPEQVLKEMENYVPAENNVWVKSRSQDLLFYNVYLNKLGLIDKNDVFVKVEHMNGNIETVKLTLTKVVNNANQNLKPYSYEIKKDDNLAIFHLNQCLFDSGYKKILNDFFNKIQLNGISKIAVDLRQNSGGDSRVIDEFLTHVKIDNYIGYTDRNNSQVCPSVKVHHDNNNLYSGKIYVLTSNMTFSSANWFAVIFKYNRIGTIIGEPTGNAPNSYGNPKSFILPNSKLVVTISQDDWLSPYLFNAKNTLDPDIYVPLTRKDVISGNDPCIEWIIKNR